MKIFLNETDRLPSDTLHCKVKATFHQPKRGARRKVAQASSPAAVPPSLWLGGSSDFNDANPEGWRHDRKPEACATKP